MELKPLTTTNPFDILGQPHPQACEPFSLLDK
jgi:hypothetical protein